MNINKFTIQILPPTIVRTVNIPNIVCSLSSVKSKESFEDQPSKALTYQAIEDENKLTRYQSPLLSNTLHFRIFNKCH